MVVVIALSVMMFTATTSVLIGLMGAPAAFAASEGYVITSADAPTIFSSKVDMDLASALEQMDNISGVSPEVFAFSSWGGEPFVVRGVDLDKLDAVGPVIHEELSMDIGPGPVGYALLGERLAARLGVDTPCAMPLAGSYSAALEVVLVAGTFTSGSPLDDEMLVTVDVARRLTGMSQDHASIIRVSSSDPEWLERLLSPKGPRFAIHDMAISKTWLVPGESCSVSVMVRNWGLSAGSVEVVFADDGEEFARETVSLGPSDSYAVSVQFSSDALGEHSISTTVSGDFPVTLESSVEVVEPYLVSSFPGTVMLGSLFEVGVMTYDGVPAEGLMVFLSDADGSSNTTGADGTCLLPADEPGIFSVGIDADGTEFDGMSVRVPSYMVEVVDPSSYPSEFLPSVTGLELSPASVKEGSSATAVLTVENGGSLPGTAMIDLMVGAELYVSLEVPLGPAEGVVVYQLVEGLGPGQHVVQAGDFSAMLDVVPWYADNPDLVELVVRYGGSSTLSSAASVPIYQAAKISEGNVALALFAIGVVSGMLAVLAIASVFSKEIREARRSLGILRALGASRGRIRALMFSQALRSSMAGSAVGVSSGLLVAVLLARSGMFVVFGHILEVGVSAGLVTATVIGAVSISLVSAFASSEMAVRETAMASIRDLPEEDSIEDDNSARLEE